VIATALRGQPHLQIKPQARAAPAQCTRKPPRKKHLPLQRHASYNPDAAAPLAVELCGPRDNVAALMVDLEIPSGGRLGKGERRGGEEDEQEHGAGRVTRRGAVRCLKVAAGGSCCGWRWRLQQARDDSHETREDSGCGASAGNCIAGDTLCQRSMMGRVTKSRSVVLRWRFLPAKRLRKQKGRSLMPAPHTNTMAMLLAAICFALLSLFSTCSASFLATAVQVGAPQITHTHRST
jgi:hypothetical protein